VWSNKNKLLHSVEGADGVKTGYTQLAKRCLISSATRNGQQIAVVTLNDRNDWADHARAIDYAFRHYPLQSLAVEGEQAEGTKLIVGRNFDYALSEAEREHVTKKVVLGDPYSIGYRLGELGRLHFILHGKVLGSVPLYEASSPGLQSLDEAADPTDLSLHSHEALWERYMHRWNELFRTLFTLES